MLPVATNVLWSVYVCLLLILDKYLDTSLASQTARKALPPTIDKSRNRKMADSPSYY